jgi:hypothetical protein
MTKKLLLLFNIAFLLFAGQLARAQNLYPTSGTSICAGCQPIGWDNLTGANNVSTIYFSEGINFPWTPVLPTTPSISGTFLSQFQGADFGAEKAGTTITNLIVNHTYTITYSVIAAKTTVHNVYPAAANIVITNAGVFVVAKKTDFLVGVGTGKWIQQTITFKAPATSVYLKFSGVGGQGSTNLKGGFVGLDIGTDAIKDNCKAGSKQVVLNKSSLTNICQKTFVDLNTTFLGVSPTGSKLVWFDNSTHTGTAVDPSKVTKTGLYYAFFYDEVNQCYNTNSSSSVVSVFIQYCSGCDAGTAQVVVSPAKLKNICPAVLVDLGQVFNGVIPDNCVLRFYTTSDHQVGTVVAGSEIFGITKWQVGVSGVYYAFFYDQVNDCFNTNNSSAAIQVTITPCPPPCDAGIEQVAVNHKLSAQCPATTVNLSNAAPNVTKVISWFTNAAHTGQKVQNPASAPAPGTYYAFYYDEVNDCWNTDNSTAVVNVGVIACPPCNAGNKQVLLTAPYTLTNICPAVLVDLGTKFGGSAPNGSSLVFYTTPNHAQGTMIAGSQIGGITKFNVGISGTYYAFFFDAINSCFNTDNSTAAIEVTIISCTPCNAGIEQVKLLETQKDKYCPSIAINLNQLLNGSAPSGSSLVWFTDANHTFANKVADPTNVAPGTYYAFFYDKPNGCYNTNNSKAIVTVNAPTLVTLNKSSTGAACPETTVNLDKLVTSISPTGGILKWFTDAAHTAGNLVADPEHAVPGTYYAFYTFFNGCFNTDNSNAKVTVAPTDCATCNAGSAQVGLNCPGNACIDIPLCSGTFFDLNSKLGVNQLPAGILIRWFANTNEGSLLSGVLVDNPSSVGPGQYYAFFYDEINHCYNQEISTSRVELVDVECSTSTKLNIKVALQGAMPAAGTTLRNDLQTYTDGVVVGVLPKTDPYGNNTVYNDINNTTGVAGSIVDWVKVDIKSANSPFTILQSKSLLLKKDGSLVDVSGQIPSFSTQVGDVYITIKHRNHLAIMSNAMSLVAGAFAVDFTDALNKVLNDGSVPDQMKQVNGVWCMINGDVSQDYFIANQDVTQTRNSFNQGGVGIYSSRDLNMNGFLENQDVTIQRNRFNSGFFSILFNY